MKKKMIALIAGAAALCIAAAGCGSQTTDTPAETAATTAAATASTAATEAAAEEEQPGWMDDDSAYLSGVTASDYVELPDGYKKQKVVVTKQGEVTEEDVDERIERELQRRGTLKEVKRKVMKWDTVNIDYVGKIDGKEFEGGSGNYNLLIGSNSFIEGFEEGLIGAKKGETLDLDLKFPDDYPHAEVAGKDCVFTVTVNTISDYDFSDEFVKSLNITNDFGLAVTDVETYREYIRGELEEERESTREWIVKRQIDDHLMETCVFKQDPPESMIESYYNQYYYFLNSAANTNYMDLATYMQMQYGATADNYDLMIRDFAEQGARFGLIYQAIADDRDMNPTEEEVRSAIAEYVDKNASGKKADDLERFLKEYIRDELMSKRVRDWLYKKCEVTEVEEKDTEDTADEGNTSEAADEGNTSEISDEGDTSEPGDEGDTSESVGEDRDAEAGTAISTEPAETDTAGSSEEDTADTAEASEETEEGN